MDPAQQIDATSEGNVNNFLGATSEGAFMMFSVNNGCPIDPSTGWGYLQGTYPLQSGDPVSYTHLVMDLGYDKPLEVVQWETYSDYNDALAAVVRGDVEYALMGTGQNLAVQEMAANGEIDIVSYQSEIMENYSCCRMVAPTDWINDNPNTVKAVLRALLRAQSYYEANKEEAVSLHAKAIDATEEYVGAYMLDDERCV